MKMLASPKMMIFLWALSWILLACSILIISENATAQVKQEWAVRYAPGMYPTIAVDAAGNVYVAGARGLEVYRDEDERSDFLTIKYGPYGNELWWARYTGPGNLDDIVTALALDGSGNVYITGYSHVTTTLTEYVTIKYDTNGNLQWITRYSGPGSSTNVPSAIAVDISSNVYVTGHGDGPDFYDYVTVKYDADGNELWVSRYNHEIYDVAVALALDSVGNVYVTGHSDRLGYDPQDLDGFRYTDDYVTVKYDHDGNELWVAVYGGMERGFSLNDSPSKMAVDGAGNVFVTGNSSNYYTGSGYGAVIKYDTDGNQQWENRFQGQVIGPLSLDPTGNVYVTGTGIDPSTGADYITTKFDSNGKILWTARFNGLANDTIYNDDTPKAIAVDALGNVYVTGESDWTALRYGYATVKYDTNGNELWFSYYSSNDCYRSPFDIALDKIGNVYVTGEGGCLNESINTIDTIKLVSTDIGDSSGRNDIPDSNNSNNGGCFLSTILQN